MKTLFTLFFLLIVFAVGAQNLVPNPSFESTNTVFCGIYTASDFNASVNNWTSPSAGSPDLYSTTIAQSCWNFQPNSTYAGPIGLKGSQWPRTGTSMAGFSCYTIPTLEQREYVSVQLSTPLIPGHIYELSFYVSLADNIEFATNRIGALLSTLPPGSAGDQPLPGTAQVEASSFITNATGWTQIVDVIMADSAYEYLTIGNFRADGATMLLSNPGGGTGVGTYGSYYYIDDVSLINWPLECADPGNIYSFTYNGHDYEIIKEKKVWGMAASCALERGGHLVHIDNAAENAEMMQQITNGANIPANYTVVNDGGGIAYVWIGATDKNAEGLWLWDGDNDNTGLNFWNGQGTAGNGGGSAAGGLYNNWGCSANGCEPDDYAGQDAAGIALAAWPYGDPGEWNDIDLNNQLYYIVEKESNGIGDAALDSGIQLFPNPAHDMIYLRGNIQQSVTRIFSIDGRELYKQNTGNIETTGISISRLAAGMYFVTISCPGNTVSHRFIKE